MTLSCKTAAVAMTWSFWLITLFTIDVVISFTPIIQPQQQHHHSFVKAQNLFTIRSRTTFLNIASSSSSSSSPGTSDRDFYEILGITPYTNSLEIKRAFRKLAKQYHPDANKDESSKEKFYELYRAYSILKDPKLREVYNMYGEEGVEDAVSGEHEDEEPEPEPYIYSNEASTFTSGLGQELIVGGFQLGGVFEPLHQPRFGNHIRSVRNAVPCDFGNFFKP